VKVLIVDDDAAFRAYVRVVIEEALPDAEIVGEGADGVEAVDLALEHRPDLVFIDFAMPKLDGAAATLAIKRAMPDTRVVMLSGTDRSSEAAAVAEVKLVRKYALNSETIRAALAE
jgi:DNA-binding NarL/FixJ family response regulator